MKKLLALPLALALLTGCNTPETVTDTAKTGTNTAVEALNAASDLSQSEMDALSVCPTENIVDLSAYSNEGIPAASEDFAAWHAENGQRSVVKTTESGLQYSVAQAGNPKAPSPVGSQIIRVNYHGFFPNGEKFDSSYDRGQPIEFPANGVIKGWIEGLGMMKPCDAWTLYIPGNLAYGPRGRPVTGAFFNRAC